MPTWKSCRYSYDLNLYKTPFILSQNEKVNKKIPSQLKSYWPSGEFVFQHVLDGSSAEFRASHFFVKQQLSWWWYRFGVSTIRHVLSFDIIVKLTQTDDIVQLWSKRQDNMLKVDESNCLISRNFYSCGSFWDERSIFKDDVVWTVSTELKLPA